MVHTVTVSEKHGRVPETSETAAVHFIETPKLEVTIEPAGRPEDGSGSSSGSGSGASGATSWKITSLRPGKENTRTFAARHLVTEEDIAAGKAEVTAEASAEISVEKEALSGTGVYAGGVIPYLVTVRNDGNRTQSIVAEDAFGLSGAAVCGTAGAAAFVREDGRMEATLKPGASVAVAYEHTVTEEDISKAVKNPATGNLAVANTVTVRDGADPGRQAEVLSSAATYADISGEEALTVWKKLKGYPDSRRPGGC